MNIFPPTYGRQFILENFQVLKRRINEIFSPQQQIIIAVALAALSSLAALYAISLCWKKRSEKEILNDEVIEEKQIFSPIRKKDTLKKEHQRQTPIQQTTHSIEASSGKKEQKNKDKFSPPKFSSILDEGNEFQSEEEEEHQQIQTTKSALTPLKVLHLETLPSVKKDSLLTPKTSSMRDKKRELSLEKERKYQWIETPKKALTVQEKVLQDQFEDGTLTGQASIEFPDGEKWTGEFKQSVFDGFGQIDFVDGKVLKAQFEEGKIIKVIELTVPIEERNHEEFDVQEATLTKKSPMCSPAKKVTSREIHNQSNQWVKQDDSLEEDVIDQLKWLYGEQTEIEDSILLTSSKEMDRQTEREEELLDDEDESESIGVFFLLLETTGTQLATIKAVDIEAQVSDHSDIPTFQQKVGQISPALKKQMQPSPFKTPQLKRKIEPSPLKTSYHKEKEESKEQGLIVKTPARSPSLYIEKQESKKEKTKPSPESKQIADSEEDEIEGQPFISESFSEIFIQSSESEKKEKTLSPSSPTKIQSKSPSLKREESKELGFLEKEDEEEKKQFLQIEKTEEGKEESLTEQLSIQELAFEPLCHPEDVQETEEEQETVLSPVRKQQLNPQFVEGIFTPNGKNGYGKMNLAGKIFDGEFKEGVLDGSYGKIIFPDGSSQEGEYRQGKLHGLGKIIHPDGDIIIGNFVDGYLEGQGQIEYADGNVLIGNFHKGSLQGEGSIISPQRRTESVKYGLGSKKQKKIYKNNKILDFFSSLNKKKDHFK